MNKNNKTLEFVLKKELGNERCILERSYSDVRTSGFVDIHTWIENRDCAKHKQHLRKWLPIIKFAPLFDFNVSMLCNAMDDDLKNYIEYEQEYLVGNKMGGTFTEVFKAVVTDDLIKDLPEEIILPRHPKYNLSKDRTELLQSVTNEHYLSLLQWLE